MASEKNKLKISIKNSMTMRDKISQKVLEKIKKGEVSPRSRWFFVVEKILVLSALFGLVFLSGIFLSLVLEITRQLDLSFFWGKSQGARTIISGFPYFWSILFFMAFFLILADFSRTRYGYRYRLRSIGFVFFLAVGFLALLFNALGFSQKSQEFLEERFSFYSKVSPLPKNFWLRPQEGFLSGEIVFVDKEGEMLFLSDWNGENWIVDYSGAVLGRMVFVEKKERIRILGKKKEENLFEASHIRPWKKGGCPDEVCQRKNHSRREGRMKY